MTKRDKPTVETTGHEWDGIVELNHPLPRWWLWVLYATIAFSLLWVILYPALPGITGSTPGILGYSSRGDVARDIAAVDAQRNAVLKDLTTMPIDDLAHDPALLRAAVAGGESAFKVHCVQCHGSGAAGSPGYPNLNDDDWLWGGSMEAIYETIRHGIRQPGDDDTRVSEMPAFGRDGVLRAAEIDQVVDYVLQISGQPADATLARKGAAIFAEQCAVCHGDDGKGGQAVGAPNLTDAIWLYGGTRADIRQTVWNSRAGVMPAWQGRLDDATIRKLVAYVHSLGGGE